MRRKRCNPRTEELKKGKNTMKNVKDIQRGSGNYVAEGTRLLGEGNSDSDFAHCSTSSPMMLKRKELQDDPRYRTDLDVSINEVRQTDFLSQLQRAGVLSLEECDLLRKFKCEGFEANELAGSNAGNTTNAVQMRLKRIMKRLRHANSAGQIAA